MHDNEENQKIMFSTSAALLGLASYVVLATIIITIFMVG